MKTKKYKVLTDYGSFFWEKFCNFVIKNFFLQRSKFLLKVEKKFIWLEKIFYYKSLLEKQSDWKDRKIYMIIRFFMKGWCYASMDLGHG